MKKHTTTQGGHWDPIIASEGKSQTERVERGGKCKMTLWRRLYCIWKAVWNQGTAFVVVNLQNKSTLGTDGRDQEK